LVLSLIFSSLLDRIGANAPDRRGRSLGKLPVGHAGKGPNSLESHPLSHDDLHLPFGFPVINYILKMEYTCSPRPCQIGKSWYRRFSKTRDRSFKIFI
jgi:hypothetical protein